MFKNLRQSLSRTRQSVFGQIAGVLGAGDITEETWEDLEALLIQADVGMPTTIYLVDRLRERVRSEGLYRADQLFEALKEELRLILVEPEVFQLEEPRLLTVVMVVGVNGSGKTTSIGKLAHYYQDQGKKVILAAADTFRAAAGEQLEVWAKRSDTDVIRQCMGADPASVAFDALNAAQARGVDVLIIDTAGRLHTKVNLMEELKKVPRVLRKRAGDAPHEVLLVLDATTGQNGLSQAKVFTKAVDVTGIVLTKLDGTARGGIVLAIQRELGIPVKWVGLGEGIEDIEWFDAEAFAEGLFG